MKKVLSTVIALLLCLVLFAGCGGGKKDDAASKPLGDGIFSTADVKFIDENGESVYEIIRGEVDSDGIAMGAYLFKRMKQVLGTSTKNVSDIEDGTDKYEILVGNTNRAESKQARQYLIESVGGRVNDFIICTIGKKLVIYGMNGESLQAACEYFINNYVKADGVKGGIKHVFKTEGDFPEATVNGTKLGNFCFVKQRFNESYLVQNQFQDSNALLTEKVGYLLEVVEDHNAASEYEIIVGNANRDGVTAITNADEYSIKVSGKKVYLNGGSPAAKAMAISEFAKMLVAGPVTDASSVTGSYAQAVAKYDTSTYYIPTWTDDFETPSDSHATGVDLTKWKWGTDSAVGHNGRTSVRSQNPNHLYVSDGMLNFFAAYDDENYYGFKITTNNKMTFQYGILEMSAILPHGSAFWISLWANSPNTVDDQNPSAFFTEVNVVEMFGNSHSEASNLHGWLKKSSARDIYNDLWAPSGVPEHWSLDGKYSNYKKYACPEGKFNDGLHTFTYIWNEEKCSFACDGNVYFTIDLNDQPHYKDTANQPIYLILSQATCFATGAGQNMADDAPEWTESNNFQIDYVHVYQKNDGKHILNLYN
ncbi:MAG: family 16 glycosylhydrolase [Clostridia bacterium]|nr:family 16 glycosylhydrolase [Clostridia bacterium]